MTGFKYYNYDSIYARNGVYNFIVGERGNGKTFGAKDKAIAANIKKGDQFIYLRRYKTELQAAKETFFADIEYKYPEWDFRVVGNLAQRAPVETRGEKKREWVVMGYFLSLSVAQTQKSVSFIKVKTIIFDEFIIEKGATHYLPKEDIAFNNFFLTVDRYKEKTRVFFLANSVSIMNPYFMAFNIKPTSEWVVMNEGFIVVHFIKPGEFANQVLQTRFGKFIEGTEYADFAVANNFADNHEMLLAKKPSSASYHMTLETTNGTFSIWYDVKTQTYFVQKPLPKRNMNFTLVAEKMGEGKTLVTFSDKIMGYMRTAFRQDKMRFDEPSTRNAMTEIFKR